MENDNFYKLLGLANRARKIITGEEMVINEIRKKRAKLVILSNDASTSTKKKIQDKCNFYEVDFVEAGDREKLGQAIGKEQRVALAVLDEGFAAKLLINLGQ